MPLSYKVPKNVRTAAVNALRAYNVRPDRVKGASGANIATALKEGTVTLDLVAHLYRFFTINERLYRAAIRDLQDDLTASVILSWRLHGDTGGKAWARRVFTQAVKDGLVEEDQYASLFRREPEQIYDLFAADAWRWEYGLDPRSAARFVEEYAHQTGNLLEINRAFGDGAKAVGNAVYRRYHTPNPFEEVYKAMVVEDVDYKLAAELDLHDLCRSANIPLSESLFPQIANKSDLTVAKTIWGQFVAYFILAVEAPDLLKEVHKGSKIPPKLIQMPQKHFAYPDPINTYIRYFHPQGSKYVNPNEVKKFTGLDVEAEHLMQRAFYGKKITRVQALKFLGRARRWTAQNKMAGSLFHLFNADWKKANWQHILDNIPIEADVQPAFAAFAAGNPMPAEGVDLQQTLSKKDTKTGVIKALSIQYGVMPTDIKSIKLRDTESGKWAKKQKTPLGVYSVIANGKVAKAKFIVLGAYTIINKNVPVIVYVPDHNETAYKFTDDGVLLDGFKDKSVVIVQGHKDMAGTIYAAPEQPEKKDQPSGAAVEAGFLAFIAAELEVPVEEVQAIALTATVSFNSFVGAYPEYFFNKWADLEYKKRSTEFSLRLFGAYEAGDQKVIAYEDDDGDPGWTDDEEFAAAVQKHYVRPKGWVSKVPEDPPFPLWVIPELGSKFGTGASNVEQVAIGDTEFAEVCKTKGFDHSFQSQWQYADATYQLLGAAQVGALFNIVFQSIVNPSELIAPMDGMATASVKDGTAYPLDTAPALPEGVHQFTKDEYAAIWGTFQIEEADVVAVSLEETESYEVAKEKGWGFRRGTVWASQMPGGQWVYYKIAGAFMQGPDPSLLVYRGADQDSTTEIKFFGDLSFSVNIKKGKVIPALQVPVTSEPKFAVGDVLDFPSARWAVLGFLSQQYLLQPLNVSYETKAATTGFQDIVEGSAEKVAHIDNLLASEPVIANVVLPNGWEHMPKAEFAEETGLKLGTVINKDGDNYWINGGVKNTAGETFVLATRPATSVNSGWPHIAYIKPILAPASDYITEYESTYEPTDPKPEPGAEDMLDVVDDETGNPAMSGTQPAFTFLKKKDWTPAVKSESEGFQWELGVKLQYGPDKTRTIIGYGFTADEVAIYVMVTEKGNVNFKSAKVGNQKYGPVIEFVQNIVDNLQPKPGYAGKQKFPKLNYGLSKHAKKLAIEHSLIYISSPGNAPFYVGTKIYDSVAAKSGWLVAWTGDPEKKEFFGVIMYKDGTWAGQSFESILNNLSLKYANTNVIDESESEVTFGKGNENVSIALTYEGGTLPTKPVEGWDDPTPIEQPAFPELPSGKHISAGIIAVFPATSTSINSGATVAALAKSTFVMTHPMNEFAGYSLTFPKGTVEPGESIEKAAVRECFEETGLTMKLVAFLGDYKGNTSVTRMFMGHVTGGDPKAAGKETDAVSLKPFHFTVEPSSFKWWSQLQKRDQKIVSDAISWMNSNGFPSNAKVQEAAEDSAITGPQDTEGEAGPTTYDPTAKFDYVKEFPKQSKSTVDYKVPVSTKQWCGSFFGTVYYEQWWYSSQLDFINAGYPPVGALIKSEGFQMPVSRVRAYVRTKELGDVEFGATYLVVQYADEEGNHTAVQVSSEAAGSTPAVPQAFEPVVATESVKPTAITADTTKDDVWKTLLFKAPFPVSQEMLDALKKKADALSSTPASFVCSKNMEGGPPYAEVIAYPALDPTPYLMAGYVGWKDAPGALFNFAVLVGGGKVQVIAAGNFLVDEWSIDSDSKVAQSPADPFFTHMDPNINALIQQIYANGGDVKAVGATVGLFKDTWMKEATVPAYAVITKPLVQDVCALFVPGAATQAQYDALVGCLKAKMKSTHKNKGKKGTSAGTPVATPQITAAAPVLPEVNVPTKVLKGKGLSIESPVYQNYVDAPQPILFKDLGQTVGGGSKPNKLLQGPGSTKWFFKMGPGAETFRPHVDRAAYLISDLVKGNNIPVGVMEFEGNVGSYQPFAEDATNPPSDPTTLSSENMAEVLSQHMVDMFMGDHDGNVGNWLRIGTQLRAIDRGQAFKFLFQNKNDSYDPTWHAAGNFGEGYAKRLLIQWGNGNVDIPKEGLQAARDAIAKVQAIADQQLEAILTPVFDARDSSPAERKKILKKLYTRRDNYLKDWTAVMKALKKGFKWPSVGVTIPKITPLKSSPKKQGFAAREAKTIKEAVAAGWQGKALQIDKDAIENQEVMVRRVTYEEKPGLKIPATLVQFRVSRVAGLQMVQMLAPKAKITIEEGGTSFGPQRLKADVVSNYYDKILPAIKSINFHLSKEKNTEINMGTIGAALGLAPELEKVFNQTKDPTKTYKPTGEPNDAVNAMADQYLQYLASIKLFVEQKEELVGQHSPIFSAFVWQEPAEDEGEPEEIPQVEIELRKQGASWPQSNAEPGEVVISGFNKPMYNAAQQAQFVIKDPITKATIFYNPPGGVQGLQSGVEGHKSIAWALMPGEPSPGVVAHIMKLFETASGKPMKPATKKDDEVLYWSKQAALLQGGGKVSPKADGTVEVEPAYAKAMQQYRMGDEDAALKGLKDFTAEQLGVPVGDLTKQPGYDPKGDYTRGAGWRRHSRIGWTAAKIRTFLGKQATVAHFVTGGTANMLDFFQKAQKNGALLSNNQKPFYGVTVNGSSYGSDFDSGGTQGLFAAFRKFGTSGDNILYFDVSVCLRTDVYVVGASDAFGNVHTERYMTPEQWKGHVKSGKVTSSSSFQINLRHDVDLQTYLLAAVCSSTGARDQVREICKKMGWTKFARGRSIEKVIVTREEAKL